MGTFQELVRRAGGEVIADSGPSTRRALLLGSWLAGALSSRRALADDLPFSPERWLVGRLTMGLTTEELTLAETLGYDDYLEYHLAHESIDDSAMGPRLAHLTTLTAQPYELISLTGGQVRNELIEAVILRAVYSKRQLFERMVEFWTDHFNIDIFNGIDSQLKTIDDRDVIRAHALGSFGNLVDASAHSPAMLFYLDNATNIVGRPNENYARELMELHTLGVTGGYTQQDVEEVARCFTGWTYYGATVQPVTNRWTFRYNGTLHDNLAKTVLGQAIPAGGGINDALTVLNILVNHASTAQFIARKLCRWFWSYDPPQALIDAVANTCTTTGGDIRQMVRTLFTTLDPATAPLKYKRPFHLFCGAMRATATSITTTSALRTQLIGAGHLPFSWVPPDGYPDTLEAWVGLILPRWNFGASLTNGNIAGSSVDTNGFLGSATTADAIVDVIDDKLFGGAMDSAEKTRIRDYLLPDPPTTQRKRDAIGLAIGSPGYQWY